MKRLFIVLLVTCLIVFSCFGCNTANKEKPDGQEETEETEIENKEEVNGEKKDSNDPKTVDLPLIGI